MWYKTKPANPSEEQRIDPGRSGGADDYRVSGTLTSKEVKNEFGCTKIHRCVKCRQNETCSREEAERYRGYKRERNRLLGERYRCSETGALCKLKKCNKYKICSKAAKKNYKAWRDAYDKNLKKELEKLSEGGV